MKKRAGKSKTYFDSHGETHQTTASRRAGSREQEAGSRVQGWVALCGQRQQGDCAISISKCSPHNIFGAAQVSMPVVSENQRKKWKESEAEVDREEVWEKRMRKGELSVNLKQQPKTQLPTLSTGTRCVCVCACVRVHAQEGQSQPTPQSVSK